MNDPPLTWAEIIRAAFRLSWLAVIYGGISILIAYAVVTNWDEITARSQKLINSFTREDAQYRCDLDDGSIVITTSPESEWIISLSGERIPSDKVTRCRPL